MERYDNHRKHSGITTKSIPLQNWQKDKKKMYPGGSHPFQQMNVYYIYIYKQNM